MNEIEKWNYQTSVDRMKVIVPKWKAMTIEVFHELHEARTNLSAQGARTDLGTNDPKLTWQGYCEDIGISKRSANRWLSRYDPVGRKMLEPPEPQEEVKQTVRAIAAETDGFNETVNALIEYKDEQLKEVQEEARKNIEIVVAIGSYLNAQEKLEKVNEENDKLQQRAKEILSRSSPSMEWIDETSAIADEWKELFKEYYALREYYPEYGVFKPPTQEELMEYAKTHSFQFEGDIGVNGEEIHGAVV